MKVRESERVVKTSVLLATGVNSEGYSELLGMHIATAESVTSWTGFFRDLKARGLGLSPVMPILVSKQLLVTCYRLRRGSGVARTLRRTSHRKYRKPSGRPYRQCFIPSSSSLMLTVCDPKLGRLLNSVKRSSRMSQAT